MSPEILLFLRRWWPALAGGALVVVILTLTYCSGKSAGSSGEVIKQQSREIQTQQDLGRANDNAGDQRLKDAARAAQQKKELDDALRDTQSPDGQRILRGCFILRQQGRDTSHLPACN